MTLYISSRILKEEGNMVDCPLNYKVDILIVQGPDGAVGERNSN